MAGTLLANKVCCNRREERKKEHMGLQSPFAFFSCMINRARLGYMLILADVCRNLVNFVKTVLKCCGVGFGQSILITLILKALNSP